jgi:FRG domain
MPMETVGSWRELDDAINDPGFGRYDHRVHSTLVFRGLARSSYRHVSSLARLSGEFASLERHLIRNFRKYAHREAPGPTMWDWLSLAQHHGLPTRLLDWTFSPLVALHFATASWPDDDAVLLAVDCEGAHALLPEALRGALGREGALVFTTEMLAAQATDLEEFDEHGRDEDPYVLFFEPPSLDERIVNQFALFSMMSSPSARLDDWLEDQGPELVRRIIIPAELKWEVRDKLDQANITERVLFPGLDGLGRWLRRHYMPVVLEPAAPPGRRPVARQRTASAPPRRPSRKRRGP